VAALAELEQYRQLSGEDKPSSGWIAELRHRTGIKAPVPAPAPEAATAPQATIAPAGTAGPAGTAAPASAAAPNGGTQ
jgi:hypothetical protein